MSLFAVFTRAGGTMLEQSRATMVVFQSRPQAVEDGYVGAPEPQRDDLSAALVELARRAELEGHDETLGAMLVCLDDAQGIRYDVELRADVRGYESLLA